MKLDAATRFLIVGLGLMGGSYAKALSAQGYSVAAITRAREDIEYALAENIIAAGAWTPDEALIAQADVIVFAVYPHVFREWIAAYQHLFRPGTLLTDVTGVKGGLVDEIQTMLRGDVEFIAAHPMAGRETSGVRSSNVEMFRPANYIVTPTARNSPEAIALCEELGRVLGFAKISRLSPAEHDKIIGFVSQLTHCIAVSLMTCNNIEGLENYTGDSFRDLTRIAKINDIMWSELFLANQTALLEQMDAFGAEFARLRGLLADGDAAGLREMMRKSTQRRRALDQ